MLFLYKPRIVHAVSRRCRVLLDNPNMIEVHFSAGPIIRERTCSTISAICFIAGDLDHLICDQQPCGNDLTQRAVVLRCFIPPDTVPLGNEGLSCISGRRICDRPLRLVISTSPMPFNVRRRTEISAHHGAPFLRRRSANRTFEFQ